MDGHPGRVCCKIVGYKSIHNTPLYSTKELSTGLTNRNGLQTQADERSKESTSWRALSTPFPGLWASVGRICAEQLFTQKHFPQYYLFSESSLC